MTIGELIDSVKREIMFREKCYPKWVLEKKMSQAKSDHELACMRAILQLLIDRQLDDATEGLRRL